MTAKKAFRLDKAAFMLGKGATSLLTAINIPEGHDVVWASQNPGIAAVDANGIVTAVSDGDAVITASLTGPDGGQKVQASCVVSVGYSGQNPYLPPSWELFIADGEPHVFDGRMYIYGSRDCPEGYMEGAPKNDWCSSDYHVIWSEDLVHWTDAGVALSIEDIPEGIRGKGTRLWAPDIFRCPKSGRYYLTFCSNGADVFIAESESPAGPFSNVRLITMGGEEIKSIDPGVLVDDDGKVFIALPFEFFIAQLDPDDYSRVMPETKVVLRPLIDESDPDYFPFEGPSLRKRDGVYYYVYIASRKGENVPTRMDYLMASDPMNISSWRYGGHFIETRDFIHAGNVHGSFCGFNGHWYLSYHRMAQGYKRFTRMMNLDAMEFEADGSIREVIRTSSGVKGAFRAGETIYAASACVFSGGRDDNRFVRPEEGDAPPDCLPGYANVMLIKDEWAGYRYVELDEDIRSITIAYRCAEAVDLQLETVAGGKTEKALLTLPGSKDGWATQNCGFSPELSGRAELRLSIASEPDGGFTLACFRFEK